MYEFVIVCYRWSARSILSRRCLPVTPWPRQCMVGPSLGWWRRSTSLWLQRCTYTSDNSSKATVEAHCGIVDVFYHDFMLSSLHVVQNELYHSSKSSTVIGLLDIYGFEVLQHNRYELYPFPFFFPQSFFCFSALSVNIYKIISKEKHWIITLILYNMYVMFNVVQYRGSNCIAFVHLKFAWM